MILIIILISVLYADNCDDLLHKLENQLRQAKTASGVHISLKQQNMIVDNLIEEYNVIAADNRDSLEVRRLGRHIMELQRRPTNDIELAQRFIYMIQFARGLKQINN